MFLTPFADVQKILFKVLFRLSVNPDFLCILNVNCKPILKRNLLTTLILPFICKKNYWLKVKIPYPSIQFHLSNLRNTNFGRRKNFAHTLN